jgi:hypothetical protein
VSAINDGGPAFPLNASDAWGGPVQGMSLRDWFAGQALAGLMAEPTDTPVATAKYARAAYIMADAMLKAREVKP